MPVEYVELTEDEERIVLATFDAIGAMAGKDPDALNRLIEETQAKTGGVQALLDSLKTLPNERAGVVMVFRPFERVSYALVMEAHRAMHVRDIVTNP